MEDYEHIGACMGGENNSVGIVMVARKNKRREQDKNIVFHWTPQGSRKLTCPYCGYAWRSKRMRDPASCPKCYRSWYPK